MQRIGKCMHQNDLRLLAKFNPRIFTEGLKVNYLKSQENFCNLFSNFFANAPTSDHIRLRRGRNGNLNTVTVYREILLYIHSETQITDLRTTLV